MKKRIPLWISLIVVCAMSTGCPNARQKALSVGLTSLNAARDGFIVYDEQHQDQLVKDATSLEDGQAKLDAYRKLREPVTQAFIVAYSALAVAALDDNMARLVEAGNAATEVYQLVKLLLKGGAK